MPDTVTLQWWGGQLEDVDIETARRLLATGHVRLVSALPAVETAMLAAPVETAMLPAAPARSMYGKKKPRKPRKKAN